MVGSRKPRCFVAMAFDHDDTDRLFDESILPVLRTLEVSPVIINRREDNRDVNIQILEQIKVCDFCIADLTYARPSVYFEAGFAERSSQVIYTAREDHLDRGAPDDKRVHFDLQMKPLIRWKNPADKRFQRRLANRLKKTVLREFRLARQREKRAAEDRQSFTSLPLHDQLQKAKECAVLQLRKAGFRKWLTPEWPEFGSWFCRPGRAMCAVIKSGPMVCSVWVDADIAPRKAHLQAFERSHLRGNESQLPDSARRITASAEELQEHYVLILLRPLRESFLRPIIPYMSKLDDGASYFLGPESGSPKQDSAARIHRSVWLHCISGVTSLPQIEQRLKSLTPNWLSKELLARRGKSVP